MDKISVQEVYQELSRRLSRSLLNKLNKVTVTDLPRIVYTSFDGDLLSYSEVMKQVALRKNLVPLNPESALGTYLVVNHYNGNKTFIIEDCISLLSKCNNFWLMSDHHINLNTHFINDLPEGVVIEILYWMKHVYPIIKIVNIKSPVDSSVIKYNGLLEASLESTQKKDIKLFLKKNKKLRKLVYLLSGEKHSKHSDWMRKKAYLENKVPLCPYTIVNQGSLTLAYGNNILKKSLVRTSLALIANEIWIFSPYEKDTMHLAEKDEDLLVELYLILKLKPSKKIRYYSFEKAGVPKYNNPQWAITEREQKYYSS